MGGADCGHPVFWTTHPSLWSDEKITRYIRSFTKKKIIKISYKVSSMIFIWKKFREDKLPKALATVKIHVFIYAMLIFLHCTDCQNSQKLQMPFIIPVDKWSCDFPKTVHTTP